MCRVNVFCCGCSLTAGAITAAVIQGLEGLGYLLITIYALLISAFLRTEDLDEAENSSTASILVFFNVLQLPDKGSDETRDKYRIDWEKSRERRLEIAGYTDIIGGIMMVLSACCFIILLCLIIAIVRKSAPWVLPWLIGNMIKLIINCIITIMVLVFTLYLWMPVVGGPIIFEIYLWIVLLNYYWQLRDRGYQPTVYYKA